MPKFKCDILGDFQTLCPSEPYLLCLEFLIFRIAIFSDLPKNSLFYDILSFIQKLRAGFANLFMFCQLGTFFAYLLLKLEI